MPEKKVLDSVLCLIFDVIQGVKVNSGKSLVNVKFIQEKKLINSYFDQISQDTGKYCFGVDDTLRALEMGAVETLICWENLDIQRYSLKNHTTGELKVLHLTTEQEKDKTHFTGKILSKNPLFQTISNFPAGKNFCILLCE